MNRIEIIEYHIEGKHLPEECEDALLVGENHLAVFDGMSSPLAEEGKRSGRLFARTAVDACRSLRPDCDAREAVDTVTDALRDLGVSHAGPFGAVGAVYSVQRREIWRIGDVHLRVNDADLPGTKDVDTAMAGYRAAYNAALLAADPDADILSTDPGLEAVTPLLTLQGHLANHVGAYGYGVFNGRHIPDAAMEIIPVSPGDEVVIATDGYLSAALTRRQAEEDLAAAQLRDPLAIGELAAMAKCLRPGFASHDDRTYLRFRLH